MVVVCRKHEPGLLHSFSSTRYLATTWCQQYSNVEYSVLLQPEIDKIMDSAQSDNHSKCHLSVPIDVAHPCSRASTDGSLRLKSWYERGSDKKKKRCYACDLCGKEGRHHNRCVSMQHFEKEVNESLNKRRRTG